MRTAPKDLDDKMIVIKGLSSQIEKSIIETYVSVIKIVFGHNKTDISRRETSTPTPHRTNLCNDHAGLLNML